MREYLLVLLIAAGATYVLSGVARGIAVRLGVMAKVRTRDVHTHPIPYFGGLAMFGGLAIAFLIALQMPFLGKYASVAHDASAVLWAGLIITVVGAIDDKYDLNPLVKLGGQVLAAGVAVMQGVWLRTIPLPNRIIGLDDATSIIVTVLVIVICVNAVNFVDGLDGLASGVVAIGSGAFFSYTYVLAYIQGLERATTASLITVATCGIAIGFLFHNWHPAKMFMGDSGAMLLGLLMAMSAISYTGQLDSSTIANGSDFFPALLPILLPVAALALPLVDLITAWIRRAWNGQHPFSADKLHLHHRLLARGHSHWGAVLIMYAWTAAVSVGLVWVALRPSAATIWIVIGVLGVLGVFTTWPVRTTTKNGSAEPETIDQAAPHE